jgi:acyl-coenzyme A synthetase/AMP-(fatty) acid ligase/acyl carrier protein
MPNGVMMTHGSILNTLKWAVEFYDLSTDDVDLQIPSCSFTSSVQDIFASLLSGGKLVMLSESKMLNARYLKMISDKYQVTHFDMVPSFYKEYLRVIRNENSLRFVLLAGEPLSFNLVKKHFEKLSSVRLFNEYGMAETCSCCFVKEITSSDNIISIGKPISNIEYKISDIDQDGVGELYVAGKGLALGYYNNSEYTDEKFVIMKGIRYLKTGDFVRENESGELIYVCRKDNQVKVNGKRVNMAEIDYILQNDENTMDSITTAAFYREKQLIMSFIKTNKNDSEYYSGMLKEKLPIHCVPNYIKFVDDFTYLPNKKIDTKRMREMFTNELDVTSMKSDDRYKNITKIISEVSKGLLNDPDIEKDLRQQGIDSISFIQLLAELEEQLNFEFGYDDIDNLKTVSIKTLYNYIINLKDE